MVRECTTAAARTCEDGVEEGGDAEEDAAHERGQPRLGPGLDARRGLGAGGGHGGDIGWEGGMLVRESAWVAYDMTHKIGRKQQKTTRSQCPPPNTSTQAHTQAHDHTSTQAQAPPLPDEDGRAREVPREHGGEAAHNEEPACARDGPRRLGEPGQVAHGPGVLADRGIGV